MRGGELDDGIETGELALCAVRVASLECHVEQAAEQLTRAQRLRCLAGARHRTEIVASLLQLLPNSNNNNTRILSRL